MRATVIRLLRLFDTEEIIVTAGGSTYFDLVADILAGWPAGMSVRTIVRSGCYLTHDDGLYSRTTPLGRRRCGTPGTSVERLGTGDFASRAESGDPDAWDGGMSPSTRTYRFPTD